MKDTRCRCCSDAAKVAAWTAALLGTFLLMAWLVHLMRLHTAPPPVDRARAAERARARADIEATGTEILNSFGKGDEAKGVYRIPIEQAMKAVVAEYRNPAAARSNLISRVEKATAAPPKAPEKPSIYE